MKKFTTGKILPSKIAPKHRLTMAETMVYSVNFILSRQLQTVKNVANV